MEATIEADRLYSFSEACKLIPSTHAGKRLHIRTLHRWRESGAVKAVSRKVGQLRQWFLWGSEIIRLRGEGQQPTQVRSPAQRDRAIAEAKERLREMGVEC